MSFHDVQMPPDISYGATGGPRYKTLILSNAGGFEKRNQEWDEALCMWSVRLQFWNDARLSALIDFFHGRAGSAFAFRFKDWSDYFVGMTLGAAGPVFLAAGSVPIMATGNGVKTTFQLCKKYTSGPITRVRNITRPVAGSAKVWLNTTEQLSGWAIDPGTGALTFTTPPPNGSSIRVAFQFDVPARFASDDMSLSIEAVRQGEWSQVGIVGIKERPAIAQGSPWTPLEISGLEYWLDALDATTPFTDTALTTQAALGQAVGGWKEKANSRHVIQATGTKRPIYTASYINGFPAVVGDGVDDYLRKATSPTLPQPLTVYMVAKAASVAAMSYYYDGSNTTTDRNRHLINGSATRQVGGSTLLSGGTENTSAHYYCDILNGTSSQAFVDGASVAGPGNAAALSLTGLTLFATLANASPLSGGISEGLIYSGAHSTDQRQQVEDYLRIKWGF